MKILICGDRNWIDGALIKETLRKEIGDRTNFCVIEGGAKGADTLGRVAAESLGIPVKEVRAQWEIYGRSAGYIRNREMLKEAPDLVLAFHANIASSKGTKDMINIARNAKIITKLITHNEVGLLT